MALVYVLPKLALLFREDDLLSLSFSYPIHTLVGNDGQECLTPLLDSAENSSQVLTLQPGGVWGRMDTCVCVANSLHCSPETITLFVNRLYPNAE